MTCKSFQSLYSTNEGAASPPEVTWRVWGVQVMGNRFSCAAFDLLKLKLQVWKDFAGRSGCTALFCFTSIHVLNRNSSYPIPVCLGVSSRCCACYLKDEPDLKSSTLNDVFLLEMSTLSEVKFPALERECCVQFWSPQCRKNKELLEGIKQRP